MSWHLGNAFLLDSDTISRLKSLTLANFEESNENLTFLLDSAATLWEKESMTVSCILSLTVFVF